MAAHASQHTERPEGPTPTELTGDEFAAFFNESLRGNPQALQYVLDRGVTQKQIDEGLIGFCPPRHRHWFIQMKGRVTVPIRNVHGQIVAFAGRVYEPMAKVTANAIWDAFPNDPDKAQKLIDRWGNAKWINEPYAKQRHLYLLDQAKEVARARGYVIVVEGYLDALVMANRDLGNTGAVSGARMSEHHAALIARYCRHAILLLDGDQAGIKALDHMVKRLKEAKVMPHIVYLPEGKDPDDVVRYLGGKTFRKALETRLDKGPEDSLKIVLK